MPLYDYDCAACGARFEVVHGLHESGPTVCSVCGGGPVKKAFAPPAIHFKGSGWAKKERRSSASAGSAKTAGTDGGAGSTPASEATTATGSTTSTDGGSASSSGASSATSGPSSD